MDLFEVINTRRSVRKYTNETVPPEVIHRALDAALLAPNSSNMQTWSFYWVRSPEKKRRLVEACLSQGAAATAQELLVAVACPRNWKRNQRALLDYFRTQAVPPLVFKYYEKLIPMVYGYQILAPLKWLLYSITGFFRPIMRRPWSWKDREEVCIKSVALACENFMLAITAQGFDTCPMEGLDEVRVKKILGLHLSDRVVMAISVGKRDPRGIWGERFRLPKNHVVYEI
jgi:nitroreductase